MAGNGARDDVLESEPMSTVEVKVLYPGHNTTVFKEIHTTRESGSQSQTSVLVEEVKELLLQSEGFNAFSEYSMVHVGAGQERTPMPDGRPIRNYTCLISNGQIEFVSINQGQQPGAGGSNQ